MFVRRPKSDQKFILSHMGVFYALVATIFVIPLLAAVVVVLIKGIIDLRYVILIGGGLLALGFCAWMVRWGIGFFRKMQSAGARSAQSYGNQMPDGQDIELSFLGGLFKVSYKGRLNQNLLETDNPGNPRLLADGSAGNQPDLVSRLQILSELKNCGDIDELEYQKIKDQIISEKFIK
jgi:hypothetical protein